MKVCHVNEMRLMDKRAINEYGIAQDLLMENAGESSYFAILEEYGIESKKFVVFCGIGNNGGDGLVVARKIHSIGGDVDVLILGDYSKFKGSAKLNYDIVKKLKIRLIDFKDIKSAKNLIENSDIIIDALFGTGLVREVEGNYEKVINLINSSGKPVVSVDIPSGINSENGQIMGVAVKANLTVTFGLPKIGNLLFPGYENGGKLYVTHISFPPEMHTSNDLKITTNDPIKLPFRCRDANKGSCGKALFIAGSSDYLGAPYLSALSFLKAGGGLSFLAAPENIAPFIASYGTEIILRPQKATVSGSLSFENKKNILDLSESVDIVVLGPGISLDSESQNLVTELIPEIKKPLLIDGDGITATVQDITCLKKRKGLTIFTPHLGEMSRLINKSIADIEANKIEILQETTSKFNSFIVMKGAHSLIGYPDKKVYINLSGNPGMATAGSGDVLTGTITAMFGLGLSIEDAVRMGVFIHGFAGDLASNEKGEDGLVSSDIMDFLPGALKMFRNNFEALYKNYYNKLYLI